MNNDISSYKKNVNSQNGEDGIVEELLSRLQHAGTARDLPPGIGHANRFPGPRRGPSFTQPRHDRSQAPGPETR